MTNFNTQTQAEIQVVAPEGYLLGIVQKILQSKKDTTILVPGKGKISIFPERKEFHASVLDMADFCCTPASQFKMQDAGDTTIQITGSGRKNIKDLLWQAAFHISTNGIIDGCSMYQIVKFRHWPNLTRLPGTPNASRICALLTRHSYTAMLVPRILGISKEEVCQILSAAYAAGIAQIVHDIGRKQGSEQDSKELEVPEKAVQPETTFFRSLFAKISGL